jgi:hypothetical protein
MYAKSCFVTLVRLNVKWSRIKPYAQCMMCVATSWIGNEILVMVGRIVFFWHEISQKCEKQ